MTAKELIAVLQAFEENQRIEIFDSAYGCIDITDIFGNEHHKSIVLSQRGSGTIKSIISNTIRRG